VSDAFRCDGCDSFYSGFPAVELKLGVNSVRASVDQPVNHQAGFGDAHPAEKPERTTRWPYHTTNVEYCVDCAVDHVLPGAADAAQRGRHALDERYATTEDGPMPWAQDPNVPTRQPAFCPYCGQSGSFDGQGQPREDWYLHHCGECGYRFVTCLPPGDSAAGGVGE